MYASKYTAREEKVGVRVRVGGELSTSYDPVQMLLHCSEHLGTNHTLKEQYTITLECRDLVCMLCLCGTVT